MGRCSVCGEQIDSISGYSCNRCTGEFCSDHRLPENHDCAGMGGSGMFTDDFEGWEFADEDAGDEPGELPGVVAYPLEAVTIVLGVLFLVVSLVFSRSGGILVFGVLPVALLGTVGAGALAAEDVAGTPAEPVVAGVEGVVSGISGIASSDSSSNSQDGADLDAREIERLIYEQVNERRVEHGRNRLSLDPGLSDVARSHSRDMGVRDYYAHESLDGETPADRAAGVCSAVGENINTEDLFRPVRAPVGTVTLQNEEEIADHLMNQWMNSEGHRENILNGRYSRVGIGVYITEDNEVYATQNFC